MSRPIRFQGAGLIYHVMSRGNNKMPICLDDLDFARLLDTLAKIVAKFEVDSWLVCVMPNHYHLVIRTRRANLSRAIRDLNGCYAQWWNRRHRHVGHVFQARFKAQIVEASVYLVRLVRYILLNPVRSGLCAQPQDWRWSSYGALAYGETHPWIDTDSLLRRLDDVDPEGMRARLIAFASPESDPEMAAFLRGDQRVIGSPAFAARFHHRAQSASKEVPAREWRIGTPSLVQILADAVCRGEGLPGGVRRAHESAAYSFAEIARCAGLSEKTVARLARGPVPGRGRRGTRQVLITDLTPPDGATQT